MGDRANVYLPRTHIEDGAEVERGVYLYTHRGGYDLPVVVRDALVACAPPEVRERLGGLGRRPPGDDRWRDPAYLNRVVFCAMVGDDHGGTTGFGISTGIEDNEHPVIRVDVAAQQVSWEGGGPWSFADYCALTDEQINEAWR